MYVVMPLVLSIHHDFGGRGYTPELELFQLNVAKVSEERSLSRTAKLSEVKK